MTSRVQVFRTPTTGVAPAAGTRQPGELWINFADFQLGMIDASRNAQKLVAVRYFQTTANYAIGDFVVQAGAVYVANTAVTAGAFSAPQWTKLLVAADLPAAYVLPAASTSVRGGVKVDGSTVTVAGDVISAPPYVLPVASTTVLGGVKVDGTTITASSGVISTAASVPAMNDNRIINGDMRIDARNNGASGTAINGYTIDRWSYAASLAAKGTWGRNLNAVAGPVGFPYYLGFQSSSAYAVLTGDYFSFEQPIEADMVSDFAWGTASAQSVTLSFWARSNLTGTFGGSLQNYASTRSYPFSYSLSTANLWTKITIAIPGDTAGTWVMSGNAGSTYLNFDFGSGATYRGPANAWAAANYLGVTGSVSVVGTNAATFYVTGVKLEIGSVATPFNRQSVARSMADCQRYYQTGAVFVGGYAAAGFSIWESYFYPVTMRATPTVAFSGQTYSNASALALNTATAYLLGSQATVTATGSAWGQGAATFSAEL